MRKYFNYSNYGNDLYLTKADAMLFTSGGDKSGDVDFLLSKPSIQKQVLNWNEDSLRKELGEYGAWSEEELENHAENLKRFVWLSASNIAEELN